MLKHKWIKLMVIFGVVMMLSAMLAGPAFAKDKTNIDLVCHFDNSGDVGHVKEVTSDQLTHHEERHLISKGKRFDDYQVFPGGASNYEKGVDCVPNGPTV